MIFLKRLFLLSVFGYVFLGHAMEEKLPLIFKFSNDFTSYRKTTDIAQWSLESDAKELFDLLEKNRSIAHAKHPSILIHGDRSYNTALALATHLNRPFFIIDGSFKLDDAFIEKLERPYTGSHTIVIKELSFLLASSILLHKSSTDPLSKEAESIDDQTDRFCNLLHRLKHQRTYLICCENVLDNLSEKLKQFFIQVDCIDISPIVEANPHENEPYFEMIWPIVSQQHYPHLFSSMNDEKSDYYGNGTQAMHKLVTLFKSSEITPFYAHQIMSSIPVKLKHNDKGFGLDDVIRKIRLLEKQSSQLNLSSQNPAGQAAYCSICMGHKKNYFKTPCCIQKISTADAQPSIDHIICSECILPYIDKDYFNCPFCRKPLKIQSKFNMELVLKSK